MPHSGHSSPEVLSLVQDFPGWRDGRFMDDRQSNQAADQIRICQVDIVAAVFRTDPFAVNAAGQIGTHDLLP